VGHRGGKICGSGDGVKRRNLRGCERGFEHRSQFTITWLLISVLSVREASKRKEERRKRKSGGLGVKGNHWTNFMGWGPLPGSYLHLDPYRQILCDTHRTSSLPLLDPRLDRCGSRKLSDPLPLKP